MLLTTFSFHIVVTLKMTFHMLTLEVCFILPQINSFLGCCWFLCLFSLTSLWMLSDEYAWWDFSTVETSEWLQRRQQNYNGNFWGSVCTENRDMYFSDLLPGHGLLSYPEVSHCCVLGALQHYFNSSLLQQCPKVPGAQRHFCTVLYCFYLPFLSGTL